jgi:anti-anti-sigma regulatory factor
MAMQCTEIEEGKVLRIEGSPDIYDAGVLHETLKHLLEAHASVVLDLSAIEACDITMLQLLCSAKKSAEKSGKIFSVRSFSPAVIQANTSLGLTNEQVGLGATEL